MTEEGADFDEVLKDAQDKGYAEKDPTADIEGHDPCRKIAILTSLVAGQQVDFEDIHILVRQEQNAAHAASGYARCSNRPGVCVATSGPGATNLITGIATAYTDSIPIVAITGQVRSDLLGRDVFQEADITGACEPFVKHSYLVCRLRQYGKPL